MTVVVFKEGRYKKTPTQYWTGNVTDEKTAKGKIAKAPETTADIMCAAKFSTERAAYEAAGLYTRLAWWRVGRRMVTRNV